MKRLLPFAFALLLSTLTIAQKLNYDLRSYQLPDIERRQLDFDINLYGNSYSYENSYSDFYYGSDSKSYNLNNHTQLQYSSFKNYADLQQEFLVSYRNNLLFNKRSYSDIKSKHFQQSQTINIKALNRWFYNGLNFYEVDFSGILLFANDKTVDDPGYDNYYGYLDYKENKELNAVASINVPLKIGAGRIEEVQDARQAIYILDALQKKNLTAREADEQEITKFADLIAGLKHERFFDYRNQKERELIAADKFLKDNGLITEDNISYFTVLNDYWDYGRRQIRRSGTSVALAFQPGIGTMYYKTKTDYHNDDYLNNKSNSDDFSLYSLNWGLEMQSEVPHSLALQSSTNVKINYGEIGAIGEDSGEKVKTIIALAKYTFGYYPNTRTNLNLNFGSQYFKPIDEDMAFKFSELLSVKCFTGLDLNYYITPQLRLNAYWSIQLDWNDGVGIIPSDLEMLDVSYLMNSISELNSNTIQADRIIQQSFGLKFVYSIF